MRHTIFAVLTACAAAGPLYAQNCGDLITASVVLTSDLGPCPGDGLVLRTRSNLTIDLNGYSILGSGAGTGIFTVDGVNLVIKGGGISGFSTGVSMGPNGSNSAVEVRDISFMDVETGVWMGRCGFCRVIDNTMQGRGGVGAGVSISESTGIKVRGNQISGFAAAITQRQGVGSGIFIIENTLTGNTEGIVTTPFDPGGLTVRANTVSGNLLNGMRLSRMQTTLDSNFVNGNGADGILIQSSFGHTLQDNIVTGNGGRGIVIELSTGAGRTADNEARNNAGFDLFWDGLGTSCWSMNLFNTSQPAVLPACP